MSRLASRRRATGFTLVELMIVVAIIGILAALAIYGVSLLIGKSKSAEAKDTLGALMRMADATYKNKMAKAEDLGEGGSGVTESQFLCDDATPVPASGPPLATKYQPDTTAGKDFNTGDSSSGWRCVGLMHDKPIYYQYHYYKGPGVVPENPHACQDDSCICGEAIGDVDGDGARSKFSLTARVSIGKDLKQQTTIFTDYEAE